MTRREAEVRAIARAAEEIEEGHPLADTLCRVSDDLELVVITNCSPTDLPRFICPLIERELPYEIRRVRCDSIRIYSTIEFQQEYQQALAESDQGPASGWTKRRFLAIKALFPPVPGVPFEDYYPERKKWARGATVKARRQGAREALGRWQSRKLVRAE